METHASSQETKSPETASGPPEHTVNLLENEDLPGKSAPWDDGLLPIDILQVTVKDCEFLACVSYLNRGFRKSYHKDLGVVYLGDIGEDEPKLRIAVMRSLMGSTGPGGSAVVVMNAVKVLRPKAVFCVGFCGGLKFDQVKLGDVVISVKLITYAPSKVTENGIEERGVKVPLRRLLSKLILSAGEGWKAPLKDPKERKVKIHRGTFLSGPEVIDNDKRRKALIKQYPEAIAIEMEGEGLYAAAHDLDIDWIVIKGVSDYADGRKSETNSWRPFSSLMAASITAHILSDAKIFQDWPHYGSTSERKEAARASSSTCFPDSVPNGEGLKRKNGEKKDAEVKEKAQTKSKKPKLQVKDGCPSQDELEGLSKKIISVWEKLGRRLEFDNEELAAFDMDNAKVSKKAYSLLMAWQKRESSAATYQVLYEALCHEFVNRRDLAEKVCCH